MRSSRAGATSTEACKLVGVAIGCVRSGGVLVYQCTDYGLRNGDPFFGHNSGMKTLAPLLILASGSLLAADLKVVEEIVAKCNGDIVTRSDIEKAQKEMADTLRREGVTGAALDQRVAEESKHLLQDRIDNLLLVQKAKDANINVDNELAKQMAAIQKESQI